MTHAGVEKDALRVLKFTTAGVSGLFRGQVLCVLVRAAQGREKVPGRSVRVETNVDFNCTRNMARGVTCFTATPEQPRSVRS
ncbi:hypothetical protein E2C01_047028 [Portunus trituberculatus]|uniref:Uncharacterized protein n=1 Tax=Portunus trituberculatus TaxID=210409 RepID=A0A5B7G7A7_PORTR|nr:hypothetical protein [Portunus trituberculatus]